MFRTYGENVGEEEIGRKGIGDTFPNGDLANVIPNVGHREIFLVDNVSVEIREKIFLDVRLLLRQNIRVPVIHKGAYIGVTWSDVIRDTVVVPPYVTSIRIGI